MNSVQNRNVEAPIVDASAPTWADADCLAADPFAGDLGDDERTLSDKIVRAAKIHSHCHDCHGPIAKGERHRCLIEAGSEGIQTFRWCGLCCEAMALQDDAAAEARISLGRERRALDDGASTAPEQPSQHPVLNTETVAP